MLQQSERAPGRAAPGEERFDGESVRRILQRAAEEQHRLENEIADSYSLEELEEMAADVRISREALHAAIEAQGRDERSAAAARASRPYARGEERGWLAALEGGMLGSWSQGFRSVVMTGTGFVALTALLLALWAVAPGVFWVTLLSMSVLSLLVLLGASPF